MSGRDDAWLSPDGDGPPGWAEAQHPGLVTAAHVAVWRRWWLWRPHAESYQTATLPLRQVRWCRAGELVRVGLELREIQRCARLGLAIPEGVGPAIYGRRTTRSGNEGVLWPVGRWQVTDLDTADR